ncbi:Hsp20/alpha crystallin family protein [Emcibacter sp. SYSU 3D8]|uniref:Hsp20/alpha crystallin family protein n=1 Tax=Emcibacter sp. SYSU 3D8 TaxID=3133969 RepID=UPI0031FEFC5C
MASEGKKSGGMPQTSSAQATTAKAPATWSPFGTLRDQIDRLFEDFSRGFPTIGHSVFDEAATRPWSFGSYGLRVPAVDVVEKNDTYLVTAELPGLTDKDIEVTLRDNILTVKGEKTSKHEERKDNMRVSERQYGSFERSFQLPGDAQSDKIEAHVTDGVLEVTIPKTTDASKKPRKIAIGKK